MLDRFAIVLYNGRVVALVKCDNGGATGAPEPAQAAFERWYDEQPTEGRFARDEDPTEYDVTEITEHDATREQEERRAHPRAV